MSGMTVMTHLDPDVAVNSHFVLGDEKTMHTLIIRNGGDDVHFIMPSDPAHVEAFLSQLDQAISFIRTMIATIQETN